MKATPEEQKNKTRTAHSDKIFEIAGGLISC
jgi:hypothetical protein